MATYDERVVRSAAAIGRAVRARRDSLELTQDQLATRGITNRYAVMKLEDGVATKQLQILLDVLHALELELVVRPKRERRTEP